MYNDSISADQIGKRLMSEAVEFKPKNRLTIPTSAGLYAIFNKEPMFVGGLRK
jgi:hypothetical protein